MFAVILAQLATCGEYMKIICLCTSCSIYNNKCVGQPALDPKIPSFYDDFNAIRNNIKDVQLIFNDNEQTTDFEIDIGIFAGLNINMSIYDDRTVNLKLIYQHNFDNGGLSLTIRDGFNLDFVHKNNGGSASNTLRIGTLDINGAKSISFPTNGDILNTIYFNSLAIPLKILSNFSSINKVKAGYEKFIIDNNEKLELTFSKTNPSFKFNDKNINLKIDPNDKLYISGPFYRSDEGDKVIINIEEGLTYLDVPMFNFTAISTLEIHGQMWPPNEKFPISFIEQVNTIVMPKGDFPFTLLADTMNIKFTGDSVIHGFVDAVRYVQDKADVNLYTIEDRPIKVQIKQYIDARIYIYSPYIDLELEKYEGSRTYETNYDFPIMFAFNEEHVSHVYIKDVQFYSGKKATFSNINCYCTIQTIYTDDQLKQKKFLAEGFIFFDLPNGTFENSEIGMIIDPSSPSADLAIPGFNKATNCMAIKFNNNGRDQLSAKIVKSAYSIPLYLCITDRNDCPYPPGFYTNPYKKIPFADDGSIRDYITGDYKEIVLSTTYKGKDVNIDLNSIPEKFTNLTITILGQTDEYSSTDIYLLTSPNAKKINTLNVQKTRLTSNLNFNMENVYFSYCMFKSGINIQFGAATKLITDIDSQISLSTISNQIRYFSVTVYNNFDNIDVPFWGGKYNKMAIYPDKVQLCAANSLDVSYSKRIPSLRKQNSICADFYHPFISSLTYESDEEIGIIFKDGIEDMNPIRINLVQNKNPNIINLYGDAWNSLALKNKIVIDRGENNLKVVLEKPGQIKNIIFNGEGTLTYEANYGLEQQICLTDPSAGGVCRAPNYVENNESAMENIEKVNSLSILITLEQSIIPTKMDFSYFDKKKVRITKYPTNTELNTIELLFDKTKEIDEVYSSTDLSSLRLDYKGNKISPIFGKLKLSDIDTTEAFKTNIDLQVAQLECQYADLTKFGKITIRDQLQVKGAVPDEEITVYFVQDEDANDIIAELKGEVTILIGDSYIKIDKMRFEITHSSQYDANFKIMERNSIVTVKYEQGVKAEKVPRITIDGSFYESTYIFDGYFPEINDDEISLIQLRAESNINVSINGKVPLSIIDAKILNITLLGKENVIHGPVDYVSDSSFYGKTSEPRHKIYNGRGDEAVTLMIKKGMKIRNLYKFENFSAIMSPNVEVTIASITKSDERETTTLAFFSYLWKEGVSKFTILSELPENVFYSDTLMINSQVFGSIDEDTSVLVNNDLTVLKAHAQDLKSEFKLKYLTDKEAGRTHGFYSTMNCLGIKSKTVSDLTEIALFAEKKPSQIPFVIDIADDSLKSSGELIINENNKQILNDLTSYLPSKINKINVVLYQDMIEDSPLNLEVISRNRDSLVLNVTTKSYTQQKAYLTIPNKETIEALFKNVILNFKTTGGDQIKAKLINFTDCVFDISNRFTIGPKSVENLVLDVDSLGVLSKNGILASFENDLTINSASIIIFTETGWEFKENMIKDSVPISESAFKKVTFEASRYILLEISKPDQTVIKGFTLNAYPSTDGVAYFEFGRYWGKLKDFGSLKINVHGAKRVNVNSASYPVPMVFDVPDNDVSYTFKEDKSGQFDIITFEKDRVFANEVFTADFTSLKPEFQQIRGEKVTFIGNSAINLYNNTGVVQLESASIEEGSFTNISHLNAMNSLTLKKGATLKGQLDLGVSSTLSLHWTLNQPPLIIADQLSKTAPKEFEIFYEDSSVDMDLFTQLLRESNGIALMKGNFQCSSLPRKEIKYRGNYKQFGENNKVLSVSCDTSSEGMVLLLYAQSDFDPSDDSQSGGKSGKLSGGSTAGIVIAAAVVVGLVAAGIVYYFQRIKIDKLKNEIPAENTAAYRSSQAETCESTSDALHESNEDPFDDV